jgi:hypothetical protein
MKKIEKTLNDFNGIGFLRYNAGAGFTTTGCSIQHW